MLILCVRGRSSALHCMLSRLHPLLGLTCVVRPVLCSVGVSSLPVAARSSAMMMGEHACQRRWHNATTHSNCTMHMQVTGFALVSLCDCWVSSLRVAHLAAGPAQGGPTRSRPRRSSTRWPSRSPASASCPQPEWPAGPSRYDSRYDCISLDTEWQLRALDAPGSVDPGRAPAPLGGCVCRHALSPSDVTLSCHP